MRVSVSFYRLADGILTGRTYSGPEHNLTVPDGQGTVSGLHDPLVKRVELDTGELVDYQPPSPVATEFETWSWDATIKRWVAAPTAAAHWRRVRAERDRRLRESDWVVIAAAERTERPSKAWIDYRQALRDITTQPDPLAIQWPEKPE